MSLIDWSDPEEMLGLLVEYVGDEAVASGDHHRIAFLHELSAQLTALTREDAGSAVAIERRLRAIAEDQPAEFAADEVMVHVHACIDELRRIATTV